MTANRPAAPAIDEAEHGGADATTLAACGVTAGHVVDLSTNVLPIEHPSAVREAIAAAVLDGGMLAGYPDRDAGTLRTLLASFHGVAEDRVLVTSGCCEAIHLVAATLVQPGDRALLLGPTFAEYARGVQLAGGRVAEVRATAEDDYSLPVDAIEAHFAHETCGTVWLCNPNNPTSRSIEPAVLADWIARHPAVTFVVDESYIEFARTAQTLIADDLPNVVVLRSMTKCYALAGMRLGYVVAPPNVIARVRSRRVPWTVSSLAELAGCVTLAHHPVYAAAIDELLVRRDRLVAELRARNWWPVVSDAGYLLMPCGDAAGFRRHLLRRGVVVRDATSFGLPGHVRVAVGTTDGVARFLDALPQPSG